jgi:hypothetical protein
LRAGFYSRAMRRGGLQRISPSCRSYCESIVPSALGGLMLVIMIVAAATRLMPHGTAAETATPQQVYFQLQNDDELIAKP